MALLGNYTVYAKTCGRNRGGATTAVERSADGTSGSIRNRYASTSWDPRSGTAQGDIEGAWLLPRKTGGMSARIFGASSTSFAAAGGVNGTATIEGAATLSVAGQLVVSAAATIAGASTVAGNAFAALAAAATIAGLSDVSAALLADGYATATLAGVGACSLTSYATGELAAEITPFAELSPQSLAAAVWAATQTDNDDEGSMGEAVAFAHIMLRNKMVTDPTAGTITVFDVDGTTVLYTADLFQDADGLIAYAGAGAERRERLE